MERILTSPPNATQLTPLPSLPTIERLVINAGIDFARGKYETKDVNGRTIYDWRVWISPEVYKTWSGVQKRLARDFCADMWNVANEKAFWLRHERGEELSPAEVAFLRESAIMRGITEPDVPAATLRSWNAFVVRLLVEHKIAVRPAVHWTHSRAWQSQRIVELSPIRTARAFAAALHEIGHVASEDNNAELRADRGVKPEWSNARCWPDGEIAAWRFARNVCTGHDGSPAWTPELQGVLAEYLWSYAITMTEDQKRKAQALIDASPRSARRFRAWPYPMASHHEILRALPPWLSSHALQLREAPATGGMLDGFIRLGV